MSKFTFTGLVNGRPWPKTPPTQCTVKRWVPELDPPLRDTVRTWLATAGIYEAEEVQYHATTKTSIARKTWGKYMLDYAEVERDVFMRGGTNDGAITVTGSGKDSIMVQDFSRMSADTFNGLLGKPRRSGGKIARPRKQHRDEPLGSRATARKK